MEKHGAQRFPPVEKMGPRIRRLRKALGMTQEALGAELGVQALSVGDWERGKYQPKGENLMALSRALGVPPHYIMYGEAGVYREAVEEIATIVDRLRSPEGVVATKAGAAGASVRAADEQRRAERREEEQAERSGPGGGGSAEAANGGSAS